MADEQIERIEDAIRVLAWWLVQAQTGFGQQDARGIEDILDGKRRAPWRVDNDIGPPAPGEGDDLPVSEVEKELGQC
jgi:hypothetical protein